jgi:hypothetical protein
MLKNILKLEGAQVLSTEQKKSINGGADKEGCNRNEYIWCLKFSGVKVNKRAFCLDYSGC